MIFIRPVGMDSCQDIEWLAESLSTIFGDKVIPVSSLTVIEDAYDLKRRQCLAEVILAKLASPVHQKSGSRVLGVTGIDLYAPGLNFVFGQADTKLGIALISLCRLRQEFYGLPTNKQLFRSRALKEAVHELGHTFGLGHCPDGRCVMHFSNSLADTDWKSASFCTGCQPRLPV